jgi:hypothetical protein
MNATNNPAAQEAAATGKDVVCRLGSLVCYDATGTQMTDAEMAIHRLTTLVANYNPKTTYAPAFVGDLAIVLMMAKKSQEMQSDYDKIKAEVIRMRDYAMRKSVPIGECVAWCAIKEHYGTGRCDQEDFDWLKEYDARSSS